MEDKGGVGLNVQGFGTDHAGGHTSHVSCAKVGGELGYHLLRTGKRVGKATANRIGSKKQTGLRVAYGFGMHCAHGNHVVHKQAVQSIYFGLQSAKCCFVDGLMRGQIVLEVTSRHRREAVPLLGIAH